MSEKDKKLVKPEEDDVSMGDILSSLDVTGVASVSGSKSGTGIRGRKTTFGMVGLKIVEAAIVLATKKKAKDLYDKKRYAKLTAAEKKAIEDKWIAVIGTGTVKLAAKLTAEQLRSRIGKNKMPIAEWLTQEVTIKGVKVPVGVYSNDGSGGISNPSIEAIDSYGPIFKSKIKRIGDELGLYNVASNVALVELSGPFAKYRPKK